MESTMVSVSIIRITIAVILFAHTHASSESENEYNEDFIQQQGNQQAIVQRVKRAIRKAPGYTICGLFAAGGLLGSLCTIPLMNTIHNQNPDNNVFDENGNQYIPVIYRTSSTGTTTLANGMAAQPILPLPPQGAMKWFCPKANVDYFNDGGSVDMYDGGWTLHGYGRVRGKTSFNLLGGSISFKMHLENVQPQVNSNFYTVSPRLDDYNFNRYCDIQEGGWESCMELDIVENNGKCKAQTTVHTEPVWGNPNCDRGGCAVMHDVWSGTINIEARWTEDGTMSVSYDGNTVTPPATAESKRKLVQTMNERGAIFVSSQWTGWVPCQYCCPQGSNLGGSTFTISDVKVQGRYVHGAAPNEC